MQLSKSYLYTMHMKVIVNYQEHLKISSERCYHKKREDFDVLSFFNG